MRTRKPTTTEKMQKCKNELELRKIFKQEGKDPQLENSLRKEINRYYVPAIH